jgi:hypothetical protein
VGRSERGNKQNFILGLTVFFCFWFLFFVFLVYIRKEFFFSYPAAVTITGDRAANLYLCPQVALMALAVRVFLRATLAATLDIGLCGFIRRTRPHAMQAIARPSPSPPQKKDSSPQCTYFLTSLVLLYV